MCTRILLATISIALMGCGTHRPASKTTLTGTYWGLRKLDGELLHPGSHEIVTVRFHSDGSIDGTAICNKVSTGTVWTQETGAQSGIVSRVKTQSAS